MRIEIQIGLIVLITLGILDLRYFLKKILEALRIMIVTHTLGITLEGEETETIKRQMNNAFNQGFKDSMKN